MNFNLKTEKGFTLVEVMVASAIFMVIVVSALSALLITSNSAKKARALRYAIDNVNYAMDNMSRTLRLGSNYYCSSSAQILPLTAGTLNDCSGGDNVITFMPAYHNEQDTAYQLVGNSIMKSFYDGTTTNNINLTAPEVQITELKFIVRGSQLPGTDAIQPSVFIRTKGTVTTNGEVTTFALQTLASQRNSE